MPEKKKAILEFNQIELNLLIRAAEHLKDAYMPSKNPGDRATVTNLENIRDKLSKASSGLIK